MLSIESKLKVSDNSGIRIVKCLKFLDGFSRQMKGGLGSLVVVSGFDYRGYTQKSSRKVFLGTIVTLKNWTRRKLGFYIRSNQNRIILLDTPDKMLGKAVKGPIGIEIRKQKLSKILFLSKYVY